MNRRPGGAVASINIALVVLAAGIFVAAAACAELYAVTPGWPYLIGALALYTADNLAIIRVVREVGLGLTMSVSTVVQLIVVNLLAVVVFRERLTGPQYLGVLLGIAAVALIAMPTSGRSR
jgi:small multidrug resistance pump